MNQQRRHGVDLVLYTAVLLLITIGVVAVYSASVFIADLRYSGEHTHYFYRQLFFAAVALVAMLIFAGLDYRIMRKMIWFAVGVSILLLIVVFSMSKINDARRWIDLGFVSLQPSEVFKFVMIYLAAHFLAPDHQSNRPKWYPYVTFGLIAVALMLIVLEPDLGTALVLAAVLVTMLFVAGMSWKWIGLGAASLATVFYVAVFQLGYKQARIMDFLAAIKDPLQGSFQVKQSALYIGSGGFFGKGIGRGAVKLFFLPEVHTDFIFANVAEEGGFIWVMLVVALFLIVFWRGMRIAATAPDRFGFYLAFGITIILTASALVNIAVTVGLIPTKGMPLPFVSYGGSSLLLCASAVGVLLNVSRRRNNKGQVLGRLD
jgi:cell division protein FtsW